MKNTLHVNLWAGPGVGKSGIASQVFGSLKENHIDCELVREYAKDLYWSNLLESAEQLIISAEQYRRQLIMHGKVDVVIVDTALIHGVLYAPTAYAKELLHILKHITINWKTQNYFLERNMDNHFDMNGREHSLLESIEVDNQMKLFLVENNIEFESIPINQAVNHILYKIQNHM